MAIEVSGSVVFYSLLAFTLLTLGIVVAARYFMSKLNESSLNEKYSKSAEKASSSNRAKFLEADVFKMSGSFFNYGLVVALGITVLALGLTEYAEKVVTGDNFVMIEEDIEMEPPRTAEPPPPPPPPPPPVIQEVPDETVLEEEEPDFVDQSVEANEVVEAPPVVKAPPPKPPPTTPPPKDGG
jgi:protein TonB